MIIEVYRGFGSRPGMPIIEPLLSDDALIQRGIAEMDANAHAFNRVDMGVVFRPGLQLGQMIEASDPSSVTPYRAKITGISISVTEALIETNLTLEQPR
ncbi:MAG: hypothetical protein CTY19_05840 [Methylomonas sp.]|nr:MAG: hypothetical protein CTY19_05840 [Methylomonas sp.]